MKKAKKKVKAKRGAKKNQLVVAKNLPPPQSLLEVVGRAAMDPRVDPAKMKALLDIQFSIEERDRSTAYDQAMVGLQSAIPPVLKDAWNDHTKSAYVRLETMSREIDPFIHQHGFALSYGNAESNLPNHYRFTCKVAHKSGHSRDYFIDLPTDTTGPKGEPNKSELHGAASAGTYAERYLKKRIFDIRIAGMDDDGNRAGIIPISEAEVTKLRALIKEFGIDEGKFCLWLKINSLNTMPTYLLGKAMFAIDDKRLKASKQPEPAKAG
jgi:hypothetical protein